ncbi:MAG: Acyl carrier protein [Candidatus Curtissbacteria bacterium GW2011_GWA1_40_9]|uniref:Acyl carrier protein n=1 Tax=Candidatus Curtissbacteria bacterium GW2011_GWA1_40_9 TaxID=1618408 RepID=A0A0G0WSF2_9BACT|nr:MAG: Acyl carrier protein [Candidatus Curtissbacteria bacterium GW2011_GWA1_40_9]
MTDTEILEEIKAIIEKQFGIEHENIEEDMELDQDLNITDLEIDDLISAIEYKYDIKIPEEKAADLVKVSDLVAYVYENINKTI